MANELALSEAKSRLESAIAKEAEAWTAEREKFLVAAQSCTLVNSEETFEIAGKFQATGTKLIKVLEAARKRVTVPIDDFKKEIMSQEKALRKEIEEEVARIKVLTTTYATEQARKAEEERRRIEEAERRNAEMQVAAEAAQQNDPFGFNAPAQQAIAPVPVATVKKAHSSANRVVEKWDFSVIDANLVPREFLSVDETKIRTFLAAKKAEGYKADQIVVAGLKISSTMQVYSR